MFREAQLFSTFRTIGGPWGLVLQTVNGIHEALDTAAGPTSRRTVRRMAHPLSERIGELYKGELKRVTPPQRLKMAHKVDILRRRNGMRKQGAANPLVVVARHAWTWKTDNGVVD